MSNQKRFLRFNTATLVSVYVLILVGGIVRSLGAGMGCPDWPKCFGSYMPPASAVELPADYEQQFLQERLEKNERLAKTLGGLGFAGLAERVRTDPNIFKTEPFDATKAWIEYANRLVGVLIGLFIFFHMVVAFRLRKEYGKVAVLGVVLFVLTAFQGWVGSLVVSTNLLPGFITFHMVLALLMVALLLWVRSIVQQQSPFMVTNKVKFLIGAFFFLLIPQIVFGTLTREQVDLLLDSGIARSNLVGSLAGIFFVHRSASWLFLLMAVVSFIWLNKNGLHQWGKLILGIVLVEVLIGVILVYASMPALMQPFHLLLGTFLFGAVFYLFLRLKTVNA